MKKPKKQQGLTHHHRICKANGGTNHPDNISVVTLSKHRAFHTLYASRPPEEIADILNAVWIDKRKKMLVVKAEEYQEVMKFLYQRRKI